MKPGDRSGRFPKAPLANNEELRSRLADEDQELLMYFDKPELVRTLNEEHLEVLINRCLSVFMSTLDDDYEPSQYGAFVDGPVIDTFIREVQRRNG